MDPATFAMDLSGEQRQMLAGKAEYLRAFRTVCLHPSLVHQAGSQQHHRGEACPLCDMGTIDGPLTAANQNLYRCTRTACLVCVVFFILLLCLFTRGEKKAVSCSECHAVDNHPRRSCPEVRRREIFVAQRRQFDPHVGRTCPYDGCGCSGIQHYRFFLSPPVSDMSKQKKGATDAT